MIHTPLQPMLRKTSSLDKIDTTCPSEAIPLKFGKRPWGAELRERYLELVNTFVNSPHESGYKITGAQEGIRTPTPDKGKRILSPSS